MNKIIIDVNKIYKSAVNIYGAENQFNMLIEELAELIQAVNKYRRTGSKNILEEIADVEIMIEQAKIILGEDLTRQIFLIKIGKLERLQDRLRSDESESTNTDKSIYSDIAELESVIQDLFCSADLSEAQDKKVQLCLSRIKEAVRGKI